MPYSHDELEIPKTDVGLVLLLLFADKAREIQVRKETRDESVYAIELFREALSEL